LNTFKEKHILDLENYKQKLDGMLRSLSIQLESTDKNMKTFTNKMIENSENTLRMELGLLNARINDLRIENYKTIFDLDKQCKQISTEYERIQEIKKEISKEFNNSVEGMKSMHKETLDSFESYKEEFNKIKARFIDLSEFVKDIRFKKNLQVDVDKKEIKNLSESLSFRHPHRSQTLKSLKPLPDLEVESEVKKYIKGIKDPKKKISQVFEHLDEHNDSSDNEKNIKANTIQTTKDLVNGSRFNSVDYKAKSTDARKNSLQMIANASRKNTSNSKIEIKADKINSIDDKSYKSNSVQIKSIDMRNKVLKDRYDVEDASKDMRNDIDFKLDENEGSIENCFRSSIINRDEDREEYDYIDPSPLTKISEQNDNQLTISHDNFKPKSSLINMSFKLDRQESGEAEYRQEVSRKIFETEKRLMEIEANTKRKLEELVSQVKVYIPINFNSYVKPQEKQITTYDNVDQNYCVNVIDANSILQNPNTGFRGDTNKPAFKRKGKVISQAEPINRRT
jgi:hypothetical protein